MAASAVLGSYLPGAGCGAVLPRAPEPLIPPGAVMLVAQVTGGLSMKSSSGRVCTHSLSRDVAPLHQP